MKKYEMETELVYNKAFVGLSKMVLPKCPIDIEAFL